MQTPLVSYNNCSLCLQEGAFTCWCTLTNARATNYGRRLDYIFADKELATKCVTDACIMQDTEGSDHCPITIELNCKCLPAKVCPPMCTKFMPEFSGKQQKLSTFFSKLTKESDIPPASCENCMKNENGCVDSMTEKGGNHSDIEKYLKRPERSKSSQQPLKRQKTEMKTSTSRGKQASLMSFFNKPTESKKLTVKVEQNINSKTFETMETCSRYFGSNSETNSGHSPIGDAKDKRINSVVDDVSKGLQANTVVNESTSQAANAWKNLLGGLGPIPLCKGHNEPCVLRMVKKPGPNKGKQFYTCARGEGLKSNPDARCEFFKWVTKKKT